MSDQQLPEGWQMVKFGDIAKHISKRVEPTETDLEIYVGLEHLDPDSLKIKRHGVPSDVAGQKLLVKKGQIIFGKRRAYQRKVAVADWDCICSAHAMVLEANSENVIPEFLPFFMQSNLFMSRAVAISEGSLSPTIKWKALEQQQFFIPEESEQRKILKTLQKIEEVEVAAYSAIDTLELAFDVFKNSVINLDFKNLLLPESIKSGVLESFVKFTSGKSKTKSEISTEKTNFESIPVYGGNGITGYTNDILIDELTVAVGRVGEYCGCVHKTHTSSWITDNALYPKWKSDDLTLNYLFLLLDCLKLNQYKSRSGQPLISQKALSNIPVRIPSKKDQLNIFEAYETFCQSVDSMNMKVLENRRLKSSLLTPSGGI
ncbi:restriction endonuclease subunit S [Vibrio vulnificus]|uniref:restriction endonuclease subunit S n=1 Tax=Vibrio vulnificus TaxID=672 RepID=UPI003D9CA1B6